MIHSSWVTIKILNVHVINLTLDMLNWLYKMHSHFVWYLRFCATGENQIYNGGNLHVIVAYPLLSTPYLLLLWRLKEPEHQQARYGPIIPEYSVFSIRRVNMWFILPVKIIILELYRLMQFSENWFQERHEDALHIHKPHIIPDVENYHGWIS